MSEKKYADNVNMKSDSTKQAFIGPLHKFQKNTSTAF